MPPILLLSLRYNMPEACPDFQLRGAPREAFGRPFPAPKPCPSRTPVPCLRGSLQNVRPGGDLGGRRVPATVRVRDSLNFFTCFLPPRTKKHSRLSVGDAPMAQLGPDSPFFWVPGALLSPVPLLRCAVVPLFARLLDQWITQPIAPLLARSMGGIQRARLSFPCVHCKYICHGT